MPKTARTILAERLECDMYWFESAIRNLREGEPTHVTMAQLQALMSSMPLRMYVGTSKPWS